ncbi:two-component system, OmpR family, KDP operon response regulator KdpE [Andreprevotia lacus DSM 23236]|jgi:two-component system KDP operon response regulator KdpE|uniref:Two-component system, OmpR family, KDP operon response regulator KdpE n=1 Tax=Andreprevotia lacus DSM 23236 TaxID=1121001 RepID=A0A1W1XM57_9NEIS|nr:two-component system response regulator KdpE [Andreprevotia lacus]SMC25033.1 two-component system, OmpR family, KDP operon response regulator KdpE [Andreprevotia lacus DSM 23236]
MDTAPITVIVIEDDKPIRRFLSTTLEAEGMHVHEAETGKQGLIDVATRKPDLVILDLGLPDIDGVDVIARLREWCTLPILVLSARTQEAEKVAALDAGADDYLTKPFGVAELMARLRVLLRRHAGQSASPQSEFTFGDVHVDLAGRQVFKGDEAVHLTPIEYRLLTTLIRHAGRVLTHRELLREVWGPSHSESSQYLRVYMGHLRQKLEDEPALPRYIVTETGVGYRLLAE